MKKVCDKWEQFLQQGDCGDHLFEEFSLRARNAAAEVVRVKDPAAAGESLLNLVKKLNVKKVVAVDCPVTKAAGVYDALRELGVKVYTDPSEIRKHAETADLGVSGVEFGVAETGSVLQDAYSIESRLISTLPPVHAVFLDSDNIVPGMADALEIVSQTFDRGYVSFITGPSRTADIERVLTIGVHGPSRFIIIASEKQSVGGVIQNGK